RLGGRATGRQVRRGTAGDPPDPGLHRRAGAQERRAGDRERRDRPGAGAGARPRARGRGAGAGGDVTDFATTDGMPCLCVHYARVTERAALAAARWLGRADQEGAEEAASSGMRTALDALPISGRIAIAPRDSEAFAVGEEVGMGGAEADLALDPP